MRIRRRRFADLAQSLATKARPMAGRCNYPKDNGRSFCKLSAGKGTAHPGSGYCEIHERGKVYDPIHRYRKIKQPSIRHALRAVAGREQNVFDLVPEILILRAMLVDFIERHYEFKEALLAWFKDGKQKPHGPLDITDASAIVEGISRLIERHHRIERAGSIDMATFRRAIEEMGVIVAKHVRDGKALEAIEAEWSEVSLDAKSPPGLPMPVVTVTSVEEDDSVNS